MATRPYEATTQADRSVPPTSPASDCQGPSQRKMQASARPKRKPMKYQDAGARSVSR